MSRFFGNAVHVAFAVPDLDKAIAKFTKAGIGPAFTLRRVRGPSRYRGERHDPLLSVAFVCSGDQLIELLMPHDNTPSSYREYLDRHPEGGLQHIAYNSSDFGESIRKAAEAGVEFRFVQEFIDGATGIAFEIYMEPVNVDDAVLIQLQYPGALDVWFDEMKAISRDWDGADPVRDGLALMPAEIRPVPVPE